MQPQSLRLQAVRSDIPYSRQPQACRPQVSISLQPAASSLQPVCRPGGARTLTPRWAPASETGMSAKIPSQVESAGRGTRTPMRTKARHVLSVVCLPFHHPGIVGWRPEAAGFRSEIPYRQQPQACGPQVSISLQPAASSLQPICRPGGSRTLTPRWAPAPQAGVSAIPPRTENLAGGQRQEAGGQQGEETLF
jgi:hypothetical protein